MVKERVITVEYLEPSMSLELLGKFPDNAALGFDYSQSGIWSPLLPRGRHAPASLLRSQVRKKLLYGSPMTIRKVKAKFSNKKKKQSANGKNLDFTQIPSPKLVCPFWNSVCWKRVLRAAAKRFKIPGKSPLQMVPPTS
ncbi:uncharacterized protein LOC122016343 [Zingiber officinale]|uniref:Uncharacterized protein n=1 Tax=Zingiber officinale TaxID=94328 RepID=A0A8J5FEP8_ZINOF|nr:uncharacterized protein LOC122016343 [Zingiber officinale]KAG6482525.1 hypothetical protein ZIOFF_059156 [Zingiber officinale]